MPLEKACWSGQESLRCAPVQARVAEHLTSPKTRSGHGPGFQEVSPEPLEGTTQRGCLYSPGDLGDKCNVRCSLGVMWCQLTSGGAGR